MFLSFGLTPYSPACCSRDSFGVKKGSIVNSWGTTPKDEREAFGCLSISLPQTTASPEVLIVNPARILIKVDFPAPFGACKPNIDPHGIDKETLSRA